MAKHKRRAKTRREEQRLHHNEPDSDSRMVSDAKTHTRRPAGPMVSANRESLTTQAAWLGREPLQRAQRESLVAQIGQRQGNQHIQRVVDTVQGQRPRAGKTLPKSALKSILADILDLQIMNQPVAKSIQLSSSLLAALQVATSLSAKDIELLWQNPPGSAHEALKRLDHALLATVPESTMKKLQGLKMSLMLGARPATERKSPAAGPETAPLPGQEKDPLLRHLAAALQDKPPDSKDMTTDALKKLIEAYLETDMGKKVKEKSLRFLFSTKGAPVTVAVGSTALAAMCVNNTSIPSTPEIPLKDNLSIKFEFEGTIQRPTGIKVLLKFTFGGPIKQMQGGRERTVLALPKELHGYINRIDRQTFFKWFAERAFYEWESATPEEEEEKLAFYVAARDHPDDLGLPDTRLAAEQIARLLVGAAIQNRIRQLQGKGPQKQIVIDLGHAHQWNRLRTVEGLAPRLAWLLKLLLPKVPYRALGIEQVTFKCGKWPITVPVKR